MINSSRGGETGRHARLKIWWAYARAGSSPALGTLQKTEKGERKTDFSFQILVSKIVLFSKSKLIPFSIFSFPFSVRGSSSVAEHNLAKVGVAGSTPVSRSILTTIFLLPIFLTTLFANEIELKLLYHINSICITPSTLGLDDFNRSCLIKLPKNRKRWIIPTYKLIDTLNRLGISVKKPVPSTITFEKKVDIDLSPLKKELEKLYRREYPTINIEDISISATSQNIEDFKFDKSNCLLKLSNAMLRHSKGTFVVKCSKKHYFFKFQIDATMQVYKANHQIKKDRIIDSNIVRKESIIFKTFYSPPLYNLKGKEIMAKQNIPKDRVVTLSMVVPVPAVKKHEMVNCFIQDGAVRIELSAEAMQNGYIGDEIILKRADGKSLRGVVLRKNLVEIK